ncbi:hypothetical protein GJAV_G00259880 [Gymnothorax javanicus]|nr:hypothetical protein GJAV_G00259880 [Gymnothorax javanicus]
MRVLDFCRRRDMQEMKRMIPASHLLLHPKQEVRRMVSSPHQLCCLTQEVNLKNATALSPLHLCPVPLKLSSNQHKLQYSIQSSKGKKEVD